MSDALLRIGAWIVSPFVALCGIGVLWTAYMLVIYAITGKMDR